jgi:hypothetical protein
MDMDSADVRWGRLKSACRVFAPRNREEMISAAFDCGFSTQEAVAIANEYGPPKSRVQGEQDQLAAVLRMFKLEHD